MSTSRAVWTLVIVQTTTYMYEIKARSHEKRREFRRSRDYRVPHAAELLSSAQQARRQTEMSFSSHRAKMAGITQYITSDVATELVWNEADWGHVYNGREIIEFTEGGQRAS